MRELRKGSSGVAGVRGDFLSIFFPKTNSAKRRSVYKPSWDFTALVFRPLPFKNDNGEIDFTAIEEGQQLAAWHKPGFDVAFLSGDRTVQFIVRHADEDISVLEESPAWILSNYLGRYKRVQYLLAQNRVADAEMEKEMMHPKIYQMLSHDTRTDVKVKSISFIQALIAVVRSQPKVPMIGLNEEDGLVPVVMLTSSATQEIESTILQPGNEYADRITDYDKGVFIRLTRHGAEYSWFPTTGKQGNNQYEASVKEKYADWLPAIPKDDKIRESLSARITHWQNTFLLLNPEEQMTYILWASIPSAYLYVALGESFKLPDRVVREAKTQLGITQVAITTPAPKTETKKALDSDIDNVVLPQLQETKESESKKSVQAEQPVQNVKTNLLNKVTESSNSTQDDEMWEELINRVRNKFVSKDNQA